MRYDLIVIGAGPAGMSAAIKASSYGATVAMIDENPVAGGKLLGQLHKESRAEWWNGREVARKLENRVQHSDIVCFQGKEVWGIYPRWKVMLNRGEELHAENVLIATGAAEKAIPVPNWTLPGVIAIGAAQTLTNFHRVKPGKNVAIIGIDPLSLSVAQQLKMAGVNVVGIFLPPSTEFSGDKSNPGKMIGYLSGMAHLAPNPFLRFAGKMAKHSFIKQAGVRLYPRSGMRVWGIPLHLRKTVLEIGGHHQVEYIKSAPINQDGMPNQEHLKTIVVDCVCISGGLYPLTELAGAVGCKFAYVEELGGHIPLHSPELETTQSGIFVAGNITGIEGAKVAMAQGDLAGTAICSKLGLLNGSHKLILRAQEKVKQVRDSTTITFQQHIEVGRKKAYQLWKDKQSN